MITTDFGDLIAARIHAEHTALAARWFERLLDLLPVDAREVFSSDTLLDHVPALIVEISECLRAPADSPAASSTPIVEKAQELGALRHSQRASLHQVLREYHLLGGVLVTFVLDELGRLSPAPPALEAAAVVSRLHQAVNTVAQSTVEAFITLYTGTISEQTERLEQFTRMAAHEWRQPLGALQVGVNLLRRRDVDEERTLRTLDAVDRTVSHLVDLTRKLETVARMQTSTDNAVVQALSISTVAGEAARQLREMADARGVAIDVSDQLPTVTADIGRLELVFVNLISNGIKYSDPAKPERMIVIAEAPGAPPPGFCRIDVRDNGLGIPAAAVSTIFQRFTRAHVDRDDALQVGGVGLGLSIVDDCVRALGGRIDVQSREHEGTTFTLSLPLEPPER